MRYVSIEECDRYFNSTTSFKTHWFWLADDEKRRSIEEAENSIDSLHEWCGKPVHTGQENSFPRDFSSCWTYEVLSDIYYNNDRKIPNDVKMAIYLYIMSIYYDSLSNDMLNLKERGVASFSDGDMSVSFKSDLEVRRKDAFYKLLPFTTFGYSIRSRR